MTATAELELELTLTAIDRRRAVLESVMDSVGSTTATEDEYDHLSDLRRIAVQLIAKARKLDAETQQRNVAA
jgi:hypothetical protein